MTMNEKAIDVAVHLDSAGGWISSKDLMVLEAPISGLQVQNGSVAFAWVSDTRLQFEGTRRGERLSGRVTIPGLPPSLPVTFAMSRQADAAPPKPYSIEPITVASVGATLSAQVYVPRTPAPHPALVLLQGSSQGPKSFAAYDADFFARLGFEVLTFDKRGTGASTGNARRASYDDLATDAAACLTALSHRPSVDRARIGLWGYSQGAMLLPLVLTRTDIVSFLIAKSPEVEGETEAAAYSDGVRVRRRGGSDADVGIVTESHRRVQAMIRGGSDRAAVEAFVRQNAQQHPFMSQTGLYGDLAIDADEFEGLYWKGRTQDFRALWQKVRLPTLALFGEDDEFVDPTKNQALLASVGNTRLTTRLFARADHNLKKAFNPAKYPDIDWPRRIDAAYDAVAQWVATNVLRPVEGAGVRGPRRYHAIHRLNFTRNTFCGRTPNRSRMSLAKANLPDASDPVRACDQTT